VARINHFGRELAKLLPTDKRVFFLTHNVYSTLLPTTVVSSVTFPSIRSNSSSSIFPYLSVRSVMGIHGTETATTLRNSSAGTDYGNGYENGYWWT